MKNQTSFRLLPIRFCLILIGLMTAGSIRAADFQFGYTIGGGALGPTLFDTAVGGGSDSGTAADLGFVAQMTNLWQVGQTIKITGVALPIRTATTSAGTWTFEFYDLDQGTNANSFDGTNNATETLVGTANVNMLSDVTSIGAYYATFDTPIIFTAQSKGIAVRFTTTTLMRLKLQNGGAQRLNTATGAVLGTGIRFTLAGSVVLPPPAGSLVWKGNVNGDWDVATTNWNYSLGDYTGFTTNYYDNGSFGPPAIFDDSLNMSFLRTNINLTTGTPLRPSSLTFANDIYDYSLGGPGKITGGTVLTNNGTRAVTLNTANDFTGGSVLNLGRIRLGNVAGLSTGPITFDGGGFSSVGATPLTITNPVFVSAAATLGDVTDNGLLTFPGTLNFNGGFGALTVNSDVLMSGVLTNGGLNGKSGPGTLTLNGQVVGTNGSWGVKGGTLVASGAGVQALVSGLNVGASAPNGVATVVITNGANVRVTDGGSFALRVGAQGQSSTTSSNYLYLAGSLGFETNVSGVLGVGAFSAYNEVNLYPGSHLRVGGIPLQNNSPGAAVININGGTIEASASSTNFITDPTLTNLSVNILAGGVTLDTVTNSITVPQPLLNGGGGGGLTKKGAGTLWLGGTNTYTGATVVQAGTLGVYPGASPNNVLTASAVVVSNGATLAADFVPVGAGTAEITSLALNGSTVSVNYGNLFGSPSPTVVFSGPGFTGVPVTISGVQTIQLTGQSFGVGQYPIIQFSTLTGSGSWVASLPPGVAGTVQTNGNQIVVNITAAPKSITWYGSTDNATINQNWNTTSFNWNFTSDKYSESGGVGDYVRFDDSAFFNGLDYATNVNLTASFAPLTMTVDNSFLNYRFATSGAGKLTGALTALVKTNSASMTILTANDYAGGSALYGPGAVLVGNNSAFGTGVVGLNGATVSSDGATARTLTNALTIGAVANTLGDAVNSGTLSLTGPVNFGGAGRDLAVNSPIVFSGSMTNGGLDEKTGPATLTFSGVTGTSSAGQWQVEDGSFVISGGNLVKSGGGIRIGSTQPNGVARIVITNGAVVNVSGAGLNARVGNDQTPGADATSTNILDVAGTFAWTTNSSGFIFMGSAGQLSQINLLSGGLLQVNAFSAGANASELNLNGGTLSPTTSRPDFLQGLTAANVLAGGVTFDTAGFDIGVAQPLQGVGGLTKTGAGTLALDGTNTYAGLTTVNGGSLGGTGVISGPVTIGALGTLSPGASIGTLTISNNLSLGGNVLVEVNKSVSPSNDIVAVTGTLSYGGTITVTNLGPALSIGDSFPVFPAGGTGTVTVVGDAGPGQAFSLDQPTGVISVVSATPSSPPLNYTNLGGGVLEFSWTGAFKLQWQTNAASAGLKTNWVDYPNPSNPVNVTNNPAVPTTFFRLINL